MSTTATARQTHSTVTRYTLLTRFFLTLFFFFFELTGWKRGRVDWEKNVGITFYLRGEPGIELMADSTIDDFVFLFKDFWKNGRSFFFGSIVDPKA